MFSDTSKNGEYNFKKYKISSDLSGNLKLFKSIFEDDDMLRTRVCKNKNTAFLVFYIDGMVKTDMVNSSVIKPLIELSGKSDFTLDDVSSYLLYAGEIKKSDNLEDIITSMLYGDTILFKEKETSALIINTKGWETRGVTEPENEKNLRGPREGFTEGLLKNTSLLRRKLLTPDLKFKTLKLGTRSKTTVCICYLDGLVKKEVLKELISRLEKIKIDGVLDTNYLDELTRDNPYSPLKTSGFTERPDVVAAKLLEGRIAIFTDGSPCAMTVPYLFIENLQSDDDYYINYFFSSISRLLRIISLMITVAVPGLYVALVAFHREMIPTPLALSIAQARQGVPLPLTIECLVMLLIFEILRESGIRMPSNVGTALSIVGAIVIGQAAVDAKFVSAPMVIIVSVTGITGLMASKLKGAVILFRTFLVICASILGIYGFTAGLIVIVCHTLSLTSFGVKYTSYLDSYKPQNFKDIYIRMPWWKMLTRPGVLSQNHIRQKR